MLEKHRIPSLDGLRALSILGVLLAHYGSRHWMYGYGRYGVIIFFIISGYLITGLMMKEKENTGTVSLSNFYVRRAFRILPVAYLYLAIMTIFFLNGTPKNEIVMAWVYLSNYLKAAPWNIGHLWSLSVEEQFYFLWPLIFVAMKPKHFAWCAVMLAPIVRIGLSVTGHHDAASLWFPAVFDSIAIGCLLALYQEKISTYPIVKSRALWILWPIVFAIPVLQFHLRGIAWHAVIPLFNFTAALCVLNAIYTKPWILNNQLAVWIGTLSYSLYIWQMPFSNKAYEIGWPIGVALAMACAIASYYIVERPILNLRKKLHTTKPARPRFAHNNAVAGIGSS